MLFRLKKFSFLNLDVRDAINKKDTPAAHKYVKVEFSSNLFGLTIAFALGRVSVDW